jgi:hypothetical protein
MTKNQKTFAYVGGGILLLLLLFRKKGMEKSLEEGAQSEEGGSGGGGFGGGGGGIFGGGGGSLPPVVAPIVPSGYVVVGNNMIAPLSALQVGNPNTLGGTPTTQPSRETPPTPTPPIQTDVAGAPVVSVPSKTAKFSDFDGDANFQDQLL